MYDISILQLITYGLGVACFRPELIGSSEDKISHATLCNFSHISGLFLPICSITLTLKNLASYDR